MGSHVSLVFRHPFNEKTLSCSWCVGGPPNQFLSSSYPFNVPFPFCLLFQMGVLRRDPATAGNSLRPWILLGTIYEAVVCNNQSKPAAAPSNPGPSRPPPPKLNELHKIAHDENFALHSSNSWPAFPNLE